jgi:hypothetical protein
MQVQGLVFDAYGTLFISVDEVWTFKPHPAVSALGSARLGLSRNTIGFVCSNGWDVAGAKAFGFQVTWVNRQGAPLEEPGVTPDLEARPQRARAGARPVRADGRSVASGAPRLMPRPGATARRWSGPSGDRATSVAARRTQGP